MCEIGAPKMPAPATVKLHTMQSMLEESSRTMRARAITFVRWILRRSNMIISDRSIRLIGKVSHGLNPIEYKRGQDRMTLATKLAGIWACRSVFRVTCDRDIDLVIIRIVITHRSPPRFACMGDFSKTALRFQ